jgi:hypothetical protein
MLAGAAACLLMFSLSACDRSLARVRELEAENKRLKEAIEAMRAKLTGEAIREERAPSKAPDLKLSIDELWTQRFEDNRFRAKQRLDGKKIRISGQVDSVSSRSLTLFGKMTRFGNVSLMVQLDEQEAARVQDRLAQLESGAEVVVEGRFLFDRMWLVDAKFIDPDAAKGGDAAAVAGGRGVAASTAN